jgi:hypothetical protein
MLATHPAHLPTTPHSITHTTPAPHQHAAAAAAAAAQDPRYLYDDSRFSEAELHKFQEAAEHF